MDVNSLSTLISNIGVPCACLIATFYLWQKETDAHKEEMKNMIDGIFDRLAEMGVSDPLVTAYWQEWSEP